jgi:Spy/CpxP family protein refolding chaperone
VKEEGMMTRIVRSIFAAAVAVSLAAAPTLTSAATAKKEETKKEETKKETKKELTPQQQKMKDCAAKWGDEKKAKKVSGRKAYNEFMSTCLKA